MPYSKPWDEAAPDGSVINADTLDTIIQDKQIATRERLEDVIPDFGNDAVQPKMLAPGSANLLVGTDGARPTDPSFEGQAYFATDTQRLYVGVDESGNLNWFETQTDPQNLPRTSVIDAGDDTYAPNGNESNATRVKNAILAAVAAGDVSVVFIPKSMWGYVGDVDFNVSNFNDNIFLVREGAIDAAYDPIAYGADPTGVKDNGGVIAYVVARAQAPVTPGVRKVAFTIPGTYLNNTNVDQGAGTVAFETLPGVAFSGTGDFTGTWERVEDAITTIGIGVAANRPASGTREGQEWFSTDTGVWSVWDGTDWVDHSTFKKAFTYNVNAAAGSRAVEAAMLKEVWIRVSGNTNGSGQYTVDFSEAGFDGFVNLANLIAITATHRTSAGAAVESTAINVVGNTVVLDVDGGAQAVTWDIHLVLSA